jgi:two-component system chemotaxis sensor kinase CheA
MDDMAEVIAEFLVESYENLDRLDVEFVELENDPGARDVLGSVFRTIHTIKGTSGFLGFDRLEGLTHVGENLLSRLRDGSLVLTPPMTSALLAMVDAVREILAIVEATGYDVEDDATDLSPLIATLTAFADGEQPDAAAAPAGEAVAATDTAATVDVVAVTESVEVVEIIEEPDGTIEIIDTETVVTDLLITPSDAPVSPTGDHEPEQRQGVTTESSIRVDVGLLDRLMNLVGELVLARNQILQHTSAANDPTFVSTSQQLNFITSELQEGVMKTRMQPIGNIWSKFPRVVRDLALSLDKRVRIEMEGEDTELDKTIIEAIKSPLTHVVRNAVDHGIESPEARVAAGKAPEGVLRLRAYHEGGQVNIEISDDGAGLNADRIRAKALERELVTREQLDRMSEREVVNLIFVPGFSTAEKVTNVSGRGVGMDVVKTNIEKIGGTIDLQSRPGEGTTMRIKIPLTLAIIPALVVATGGARYAIPQVSLLELVRLDGEQARTGIEYVGGVPVHRLRGNLLPILELRTVLGLPPAEEKPDAVNIVVLQADDRQFGLIVEGISDTEEIVVKPLGRHLKQIPAFAGTTIMGDGTVSLILDVLGIAQEGDVVSASREAAAAAGGHASDGPEVDADTETVLVCTVGEQRVAIPLGLINRLEEFPSSIVESASGRQVVQYREQLLNLVSIADMLGIRAADRGPEDPIEVLVHSRGDTHVGFVVDSIVDVVDQAVAVRSESSRPGVRWSAVVGGKVTDLLDVGVILAMAGYEFLETDDATAVADDNDTHGLLVGSDGGAR